MAEDVRIKSDYSMCLRLRDGSYVIVRDEAGLWWRVRVVEGCAGGEPGMPYTTGVVAMRRHGGALAEKREFPLEKLTVVDDLRKYAEENGWVLRTRAQAERLAERK